MVVVVITRPGQFASLLHKQTQPSTLFVLMEDVYLKIFQATFIDNSFGGGAVVLLRKYILHSDAKTPLVHFALSALARQTMCSTNPSYQY